MRAREVYEKYQVPPWLQLHQVRVAAVADTVARMHADANVSLIVTTCLVHDIGAIVKFDFEYMRRALPGLASADEIPHWEAVQKEIRARYGTEEHEATDAILSDLGKSNEREIFDQMGLTNMPRILASGDRNLQIVQYADMRVGPFGVLSIQERLADGAARYASVWEEDGTARIANSFPRDVQKLEEILFAGVERRPEDISDASIAVRMQELWDYAIA